MESICKVQGCNRVVYVKSKQLCSAHYNRLRTTGSTGDGPRARAPVEVRFAKQVDVRGPDDCWLWIGKSMIDGYGVISLGGRGAEKVLAHRFAWEIVNGPIPSGDGYHGTVVRHRCDVRACVNPAHLELGTQADNVRDQVQRGRLVMPELIGEQHGNSRFTEADIRYIRSSVKSNAELGREFNCERAVISGIRLRKSWKHLA